MQFNIILLNALIIITLINAKIFASNNTNQCIYFNKIALQLALSQNNTQAPLKLQQLQIMLGYKKPNSSSVTNTYSWANNNRFLIVSSNNGDLTTKLLIGQDDGSAISKKIELLYEKLKSATSIWTIKEIQEQLGPAHQIATSKLQNYIWECGPGTLEVSANQNNLLATAMISYKTNNQDQIEKQVGTSHPPWDIVTNSLAQSYCAWKRSYNPND